jgi:hypothetical protein
MTPRNEVITAIVEAIAEAEGCEAHELEFSLQNHVDADALRNLATAEHDDWQLVFHVPEHTVSIRANGQILVDGTVRRELDLPVSEA